MYGIIRVKRLFTGKNSVVFNDKKKLPQPTTKEIIMTIFSINLSVCAFSCEQATIIVRSINSQRARIHTVTSIMKSYHEILNGYVKTNFYAYNLPS